MLNQERMFGSVWDQRDPVDSKSSRNFCMIQLLKIVYLFQV
jgi:hypothetical protein